MNWDYAKSFALQYKRPKKTTGTVQGYKDKFGTNSPSSFVKFSIDTDQWKRLCEMYLEPDEAFFCLPVVLDRTGMPNNLQKETIFIDIHGISVDNPTRVYIPDNHEEQSRVRLPLGGVDTLSGISNKTIEHLKSPEILVRGSDGPEVVDRKSIFYWDTLWSRILSCQSGTVIIRNRQRVRFNEEVEGGVSNNTRVITAGGSRLPQRMEEAWS